MILRVTQSSSVSYRQSGSDSVPSCVSYRQSSSDSEGGTVK